MKEWWCLLLQKLVYKTGYSYTKKHLIPNPSRMKSLMIPVMVMFLVVLQVKKMKMKQDQKERKFHLQHKQNIIIAIKGQNIITEKANEVMNKWLKHFCVG